jgi:hypothetical protein
MRWFTVLGTTLRSAVILLLCSAPCPAQFFDWQGSGTNGITATSATDSSTIWNVSANWNRGIAPGQFDVADLEFENPGRVYITTSPNVCFIYLSGSEPDARLVVEFFAAEQ